AHYVAVTTQTYRAAIDAAKAREQFSLTRQQELDLAQSFSRGFTHGFLSGVNHQELVQGRFPKNRGVRIGAVVEVTNPGRGADGGFASGKALPLDGGGLGGGAASNDSRPPTPALPHEGGGENRCELPLKPGDGVVFDEGHPEQDEQGG